MSIRRENLLGNIAVLYGGQSAEREVSLKSGAAVLNAFDQLDQPVIAIDVKTSELITEIKKQGVKHCFIALHGGDGEDGTVQALLKSEGISYTGSDMASSAIAMDKYRTKLIWQAADISTAKFMLVDNKTKWSDVEFALGNKMMIKPANEGSSIGMSVVKDEKSFEQAMVLALQYDSLIIAEKWIEGSEYTVAIVADKAMPMIQLKTNNSFYDYEAKYETNDTEYLLPCGLPKEVEQSIQAEALKAFNVLGCSGWGRIDVMIDEDEQFYFLEANTSPGMTDHSLVPMAAAAADMSFHHLVAHVLNLSLSHDN